MVCVSCCVEERAGGCGRRFFRFFLNFSGIVREVVVADLLVGTLHSNSYIIHFEAMHSKLSTPQGAVVPSKLHHPFRREANMHSKSSPGWRRALQAHHPLRSQTA